ncbi:hypothetical protein ACIQPR_43750 [Streptomyces sp. NPDC091280]|uniref:hypothetical protein n=1 Tax=Streptomyces sp. NPDC091280 TaxID=3365984 RepID=UPI00380A75BF
MTLELGVEDSGAIPQVVLKSHTPHLRDKEDVREEGALPDLYGLGRRSRTLSQFLDAVEGERRLRTKLRELIDQCTDMRCMEDDETWGLLIIRTHARSRRHPRSAVEYVDVIVSDQVDAEGRERVRDLEVEMEASLMVGVEYETYDRPHAWIPGSNSFKIVRYAKAVLA